MMNHDGALAGKSLPTPTPQLDIVRGSAEVVGDLVGVLGRPLVAALSGVSSTRVVREWERGGGIGERREDVIRLALQAASIVKQRYGDGAVQSWFTINDEALGDRAPVHLLAEMASATTLDHPALRRRVLKAAWALASS